MVIMKIYRALENLQYVEGFEDILQGLNQHKGEDNWH